MQAVQGLTNNSAIEIKTTENSDVIQYKYSDEKDWKDANVELQPRDNTNEDIDVAPAFTTINGTTYYIDEFLVV
jgi:hypothetical protein